MTALRSLVVIGLILTASGFLSETLGDYIGPLEYKGYLVFAYPEGDNPINNIVFTVDSTLAGNLVIVDVPTPWSHSYSNGVLTLTGGTVNPGESVQVAVSLNKYFEQGEYPVSSVGTTTAGEVGNAQGVLLVGDLILLRFLETLSDYLYPLAAFVGGLAILEFFLSRRTQRDTTVAISKEPKTCQELIDECDKAKAAAEAAEAEAKSAREDADKANLEQENAQERLDKAEKNLDKITQDKTDDSGAWVEMDGRRITSMDLKLKSDASKALWEQYQNGEIDAKSLEDAWKELGEDSALDELRKQNKDEAEKAVKDATDQLAETEKKAQEAKKKAAEAEKKAADAKTHAEEVCKKADDCVKAEKEKSTETDTGGGTVSGPAGPVVVDDGGEKTRERKCKEGDRETRPAGSPESITVDVDFSLIVESSGIRNVEGAKTMAFELNNLAQDLDLAGSLLGGASSGTSIVGGIGAMKSGKYVSGAGGLVSGTVSGVMTGAGASVGVEGMEVSIPTSPPEAITEVLEATAKLGAIVAGKVGEWLVMNELYTVRLRFFRQKLTATPYEVWECRGGQLVCVQKIFEIEISKLMRSGQPTPKDFKLESDIARRRFTSHINRLSNMAKNRLESAARKRAKFEQDHRPGPCGS